MLTADGALDDLALAMGAAGATEASMQQFLTCLNEADNPDECEVLGKEAVEQATKLGAAMAGLVPYSSRTFEEFEAEITS